MSAASGDNGTKDVFAAKVSPAAPLLPPATASLTPSRSPQRYINETKRLYQVYEERLSSGREYLVGEGSGKFSYADCVTFTWIRACPYSLGITDLAKAGFPNLDAYVKRCEARPAVAKAIEGDMIQKMLSAPEAEANIRKRVAWVEEADEKKKDEL